MATTSVPQQPEIVRQFFQEDHFDGTLEQLITALEGPQKSPLTLKQQAQVYTLLWALDGYIRMLREHVHTGSAIRICNFAQSAVLEMFGAVPLTDAGGDKAHQLVASLPDKNPIKQSIAFKRAQHAAYDRKHGLVR